MTDSGRPSFDEEDLAGSVRSLELETSRLDSNLSPVNEEDEWKHESHQRNNKPPTFDGSFNASFGVSGSGSRPMSLRRATDPIAPISTGLHLRPSVSSSMGRSRTRSPYSRSHIRSRSNTSLGHPMTRAYSSPLSDTVVPDLAPFPQSHSPSPSQMAYSRPESPMGWSSYGRRASPRRHLDEPFIYNPAEVATPSVPTIEENVELSLPSPSSTIPEEGVPIPISPFTHASFPRPSRRRPSSPLHSLAPRTHSPGARILHTSSSVPTLSMSRSGSNGSGVGIPVTPTGTGPNLTSPASRYNESYPMSPVPDRSSSAASGAMASSASSMYSLSMTSSSVYSGGSSMPSTPTSMRSRSPSINSLDTIPDSPDAEAEAIEQEKADRMERLERMEKLRSMIGNRESEELGRRMLGGGGGSSGSAGSAAKERKRWSVCGAERRGDLEMETIWED